MNTYKEMLALLHQAHVDIELLDAGEKNSHDLYKEWTEREVNLVFMPALGLEPAYIARVALQVAIKVLIPLEQLQYLEVKRVYLSGKVVEKVRGWTVTETCRRGYDMSIEAVRAAKDELGLDVIPEQLFLVQQEYPKPYFSSVFNGIKTHAMIQYFDLYLRERPWSEKVKLVKDTSKLIYVEEFPFHYSSAYP